MRTPSSKLAPFLRSEAHGRILAAILLARAEEQSLSELAEAAGVPLATVQREVSHLTAAGVVTTRKLGPARLVAVNDRYPLLAPLRQIIVATYGPLQAIGDAFAGLPGLDHLIVFGSWAARLEGRSGPFPADVDVLVVGNVSRLEAYERAINAGDRIGREVNATIVSADRWNESSEGFLADVRSKPYLELEVAA